MPLPEPSPDETRDDFIARCMGDNVMLDEFPEQDQRMAVCIRQYDDNPGGTLQKQEFPFASMSECIDRMEGEVDDPGAFCKWLYEQTGGGGNPNEIHPVAVEGQTRGIRIIIIKNGDTIGLWTFDDGAGSRITDGHQDLKKSVEKIPGNVMLDGVLKDDQVELSDIPFYGKDLSGMPLHERRKRLEAFFEDHLESSEPFTLSTYTVAQTKEELKEAMDAVSKSSEKVTIKLLDSRYGTGGMKEWLEVKKK